MWDLSSLTRDRTHVPCTVRRILYHWTAREVPKSENLEIDIVERLHLMLSIQVRV